MNPKEKGDYRPERSFALTRLEVKKAPSPDKVDGEAAEPAGSFDGYAALWDSPHQTSAWWLGPDWTDIVAKGAFSRTLSEHKKRGTTPAMLFQHDPDDPIGAWQGVQEDETGLSVDGQLCIAVQEIKDLHELMKMGGVRGLSIGFAAMEFKLDEKKKERTLLDLELAEISVVTMAGEPSAMVTDVKGQDLSNVFRDFEKRLRDAGHSRSEAKRFIAAGREALGLQRDADDDELIAALKKASKTLKGE
jgi:HK97 family phage prohead protease